MTLTQIIKTYWNPLSLQDILWGLVAFIFCMALFFFLLSLQWHLKQEKAIQTEKDFQNHFEPLILAVLFQEADPNTIWNQLKPHQSLPLMDLLLGFYQRLSGHSLDKLALIARPYLHEFRALTQHRRAELRARAYKVLSTFAPIDFETQLLKGLKDPSPMVVQIAFQALCDPRFQGDHQTLLDSLALLEHFSADYISALLHKRGGALAPDLRAIFENKTAHPRIRVMAGKTLILLQDIQAIQSALSILEHENQPDILVPALVLLEKLGTAEVSPAILPHLNSEYFAVRAYVIKVLSCLGRETYSELYLKALEDPSPWVAKQGVQALILSGQTQLLTNLIDTAHPSAQLAASMLENTP